MDTYDPKAIEEKWQEVWEAERAFYTDDPAPTEKDPAKPEGKEKVAAPHCHVVWIVRGTALAIPLRGEERSGPSTKMSLPAPPSYPGNLKPVCGYPRRVSPFRGTLPRHLAEGHARRRAV